MSARTDVTAEGNFLLPNGTFFAELVIFLIVLGIIWLFVVPPVRKVLAEREQRASETSANSKVAKEVSEDAEARYQAGLEQARSEAAEIRNQARAEGRAILEEMRGDAQREADGIVAESEAELRSQAEQVAAELRREVEPLAQSLANRVVDGDDRHAGSGSGHNTGRASS